MSIETKRVIMDLCYKKGYIEEMKKPIMETILILFYITILSYFIYLLILPEYAKTYKNEKASRSLILLPVVIGFDCMLISAVLNSNMKYLYKKITDEDLLVLNENERSKVKNLINEL